LDQIFAYVLGGHIQGQILKSLVIVPRFCPAGWTHHGCRCSKPHYLWVISRRCVSCGWDGLNR